MKCYLTDFTAAKSNVAHGLILRPGTVPSDLLDSAAVFRSATMLVSIIKVCRL